MISGNPIKNSTYWKKIATHMKKAFRITLCLLLVPFCSSTLLAQRVDLIRAGAVRVEGGFVGGTTTADNTVKIFKGIPYAAPPVGDLRWKEPQPVKDWKGILPCKTYAASAMQGNPVPFGVYTEEFLIPKNGSISEDCLYLNVWTTARTRHEYRPVIVFIHGGGFVAGGSACPIYDGEALARKGIVFITINYRLGVFGFLSHPELTKESPHHASGNYGILDQIAALKWIRRNVDAFGGDPENITIAGQSAGAMSVNVLDASPVAQGLFTKMIAESGASIVPGHFGGSLPLDSAESLGLSFQKSLGASDLSALRSLPADSLLAAWKGGNAVIVDKYVLPESVSSIFAKGKQAIIPLLTGYNADDVMGETPTTLNGYKDYLDRRFAGDATKVLKLYPAVNDEQATKAARNVSRDMGFGVQNFAWSVFQSHYGQFKTYMYFFTRKVPESGPVNKYGAFHTGEVMYAYNSLDYLNRPVTDDDRELARIMSSYWANFAKAGDPNGKGLPVWPQFNEHKQEVMILDLKPEAKRHPYGDGLEYFFLRDMPQDQ